MAAEDCLATNIRQNKLGKAIEDSAQEWPKEGRRQYHAISRGWIANEIFRRVHPEGSTIGEFLKSEISQPLDANISVGTTVANYAPVKDMKFSFVLGQSFIPKVLGKAVDCNFFELASLLNAMRKFIKKGHPPP